VLKLRDWTRKRDKLFIHSNLHQNQPTSWLVRILKHPWCLDKPWATLYSLDLPQPRFGGSHHLLPYSIFCVSPSHLHLNGIFSWDSQSGVPKLSRFGLPRLWAFITSCSNLGLGRGLKQTCSLPWKLSNGVLHSTCTHRNWVDSRLLVVGSQIASLIPGPSFDHNLCYKCPNGSCKAILDIYISRPFQWYKEHFNARCFDPYNCVLNFQESRRTPKFHFSGMWVATSHFPQSGVATLKPIFPFKPIKESISTSILEHSLMPNFLFIMFIKPLVHHLVRF